jgi:hypothetical protein
MPLMVALFLVAAIAVGLGLSFMKRNHESNGVANPASTSTTGNPGSDPAATKGTPADSAAQQPYQGNQAPLIN